MRCSGTRSQLSICRHSMNWRTLFSARNSLMTGRSLWDMGMPVILSGNNGLLAWSCDILPHFGTEHDMLIRNRLG